MSLDHIETTASDREVALIDRADQLPAIAQESLDSELSAPLLFRTAKRSKTSIVAGLGLLLSVGSHFGLALIPTGSNPEPTPVKTETKQVRISQLARPTQMPKSPRKVTKPSAKLPTRPQSVPAIRQAAPIVQPQPVPKPKTQEPQQIQEPQQTQEPLQPSSWDDFPIYPTAKAGCFNLPSCLQTADSLQQITDFYSKELPAKKYELKLAIQEPNRQVFQVSRKGETQFLSIIKTQKDHVIVLADAPRSLDDLGKAVEVPAEVAEILSNLDAKNAEPTHFAKPDLFYTQSALKPGIISTSLVKSYSYDTMMNEFFRSNLQNAGFEVTDLPQTYGDGKLYEIRKETLKLYLNLVPMEGGALIVAWKDLPQ
jgi:hypothetical protein